MSKRLGTARERFRLCSRVVHLWFLKHNVVSVACGYWISVKGVRQKAGTVRGRVTLAQNFRDAELSRRRLRPCISLSISAQLSLPKGYLPQFSANLALFGGDRARLSAVRCLVDMLLAFASMPKKVDAPGGPVGPPAEDSAPAPQHRLL